MTCDRLKGIGQAVLALRYPARYNSRKWVVFGRREWGCTIEPSPWNTGRTLCGSGLDRMLSMIG